MGWESFNVKDVDTSPKPITPGTYTLQLTGAFDSKYQAGQTDVLFRIVGDTPEAGKSVRLQIPDIDERPWAGELYANLVSKLGADVEAYAHPRDVLMKCAGNGHNRIQARVYTKTFTKSDGTEGWRDEIAGRSIRASV